jgi:hypothetical protein
LGSGLLRAIRPDSGLGSPYLLVNWQHISEGVCFYRSLFIPVLKRDKGEGEIVQFIWKSVNADFPNMEERKEKQVSVQISI